MNMTVGDCAAMASIGAAGAAVLFWALRGKLGTEFATKEEHDETAHRLDAIEKRLTLVPSHEDFRLLSNKVAEVAKDVAVVTANMGNLKESLGRIEHQLAMFVQAQLEQEKRRT